MLPNNNSNSNNNNNDSSNSLLNSIINLSTSISTSLFGSSSSPQNRSIDLASPDVAKILREYYSIPTS